MKIINDIGFLLIDINWVLHHF